LSRKILILISIGVLIALAATAAAYFYAHSEGESTAEVFNHLQKSVTDYFESEHETFIYEMEPVITDINCEDESKEGVVRVSLQFEGKNQETEDEINARWTSVRDEIIAILRSSDPDSLAGDEGMKKLAEEVIEQVNKILDDGEILDVYFTDMIVQ